MSARTLTRAAGAPRGRSRRGLDLLNFFLANVQTGFGPFIAVYLTAESWTQVEIGLVLSVGTICGMASQVPAGALIDATPRKRLAAGAAIAAILASALIFALWPSPLPVLIAEVLHGFASAMVVPAIAAITLAMVSRSEVGERLGRNASWAAVGNGFAAGAMGAIGYTVSYHAVFWLTAALAVPALAALWMVGRTREPRAILVPPKRAARGELRRLFTDRRLIAFAACFALFQLGNAAMLQLVGGELTERVGSRATIIIAGCIVVPQLVVAGLSPWVGRRAEQWGRRPILLFGLLALPLRALLFAATASPALVIGLQALDGISGAAFGVLVPLIAADVTLGTNRFNLCMGALALAGGIGATVSTTLAGVIADSYTLPAAFIALAAAGAASVLVWTAMPETRLKAVSRPSPRRELPKYPVDDADAAADIAVAKRLARVADLADERPANRL